jgi:hypothetical protein
VPWDTWQHRSPLRWRGGVQSLGTFGNTGVIPKKGGEFWSCDGTWQRMGTCLALCLGLKAVCGVPGLQGTDTNITARLLKVRLVFDQITLSLYD